MSCALFAALRRLPRACLLAFALCVPVAQALASVHLASTHPASAHPVGRADAAAIAVGASSEAVTAQAETQSAAQLAGLSGQKDHAGLGAHGACGQCLQALAFHGAAPGTTPAGPLPLNLAEAQVALLPTPPPAPQAVSPFMGRAPPRSALI